MDVRFSVRADADLEEIADYIAADSPLRAVSFAKELRAACFALGASAMRYPLLRGVEDLNVRQRLHGRYRIIYRVQDRFVQIVRVLHGSRAYERLLSDEN